VLEFYINFDCSEESRCLTEESISLLARISKGLYLGQEFSQQYFGAQELILRRRCLHALVAVSANLLSFLQAVGRDRADGKSKNCSIRHLNSKSLLSESFINCGKEFGSNPSFLFTLSKAEESSSFFINSFCSLLSQSRGEALAKDR